MQPDILKKIKSRIIMINDDIRGNLQSLSLEGNFTEDTVTFYTEQQQKALQYVQDIKHLQLVLQDLRKNTAAELNVQAGKLELKVKKDDVCSQLSVETTGIYFRTKRFLVDTENFKITENTTELTGTIYATSGEIAGWKIEGNSLVGQNSGKENVSLIEGGTLEADNITASDLDIGDLDLNPDYELDYKEINMKNALINSSKDVGDDTQFGDFTCWGSVTLEGATSLECGELNCTQLIGRGTSGYITLYCDEIVTAEESFSDRRLKKDIKVIGKESLGMLDKLRPVSYRYKKDGRAGTGFIAQELLPVAKAYGFHSMVEERGGYYGIGYRQLVPLLILAAKENLKQLEELHGRESRTDG